MEFYTDLQVGDKVKIVEIHEDDAFYNNQGVVLDKVFTVSCVGIGHPDTWVSFDVQERYITNDSFYMVRVVKGGEEALVENKRVLTEKQKAALLKGAKKSAIKGFINRVRKIDEEAAKWLESKGDYFFCWYIGKKISLISLFSWRTTPQGYKYWSDLYDKMEGNE